MRPMTRDVRLRGLSSASRGQNFMASASKVSDSSRFQSLSNDLLFYKYGISKLNISIVSIIINTDKAPHVLLT